MTFRALESLGIAQRITFCQERLLCAVTEADLLGDLLGINSASKMRWLIHREKIELVCVLSLNVDMLQQTCDEFRPQTLPSYHMIHTRSWGSWLCQVIPVRSAAMVTSMCIFHYLSRTPKKLERLTESTEKNLATKKATCYIFDASCFFLHIQLRATPFNGAKHRPFFFWNRRKALPSMKTLDLHLEVRRTLVEDFGRRNSFIFWAFEYSKPLF